MPSARNLRVLVVDDQQSMRGLTRYSLQQLGIKQIVEASSGQAALMEMKIGRFDAIVSDWNMAGMDGLSFLKFIRANPVTKRIPFIMATGNNDKEQIQAARAAGVSEYVIKPFNVATLKAKLETALGGPLTP